MEVGLEDVEKFEEVELVKRGQREMDLWWMDVHERDDRRMNFNEYEDASEIVVGIGADASVSVFLSDVDDADSDSDADSDADADVDDGCNTAR